MVTTVLWSYDSLEAEKVLYFHPLWSYFDKMPGMLMANIYWSHASPSRAKAGAATPCEHKEPKVRLIRVTGSADAVHCFHCFVLLASGDNKEGLGGGLHMSFSYNNYLLWYMEKGLSVYLKLHASNFKQLQYKCQEQNTSIFIAH